MEQFKSRKLEQFMRVSVLLDRSFFIALTLVCIGVLALCVSLYYNASAGAYNVYMRRAQFSTLSLSKIIDSTFTRLAETQRKFIHAEESVLSSALTSSKLEVLSEILSTDGVIGIVQLTPEGKVLASCPANGFKGSDEILELYLQRMRSHPRTAISTPPFSIGQNSVVALMSPAFNVETGALSSVLCYLVDVEQLFKKAFREINFSEYEYAWVFDNNLAIVFGQGNMPSMGGAVSLDRRRFMASALARRYGYDTYTRDTEGGREEYLVYYSAIPLDAFSQWIVCVEAPREAIRMASDGFPIVYALPLGIFFFMIFILSLLKRYFGNRYVRILESVIAMSRDARKEIESRLVAIMESFPYVIFETDKAGMFTFLNFSQEHMGGLSVDSLQGKNLIEMVESSENLSFRDSFMRMVGEGGIIKHLRVSMSLDGSSVRVMSMNASPVYDDAKQIVGARGVMHDITERVDLELHLVQSQKMDSIGMVASGIAHDFNNYISTILGYISMLKMKGADCEELQSLEKAAHNAAKLTGQLLEFSKKKDKSQQLFCEAPGDVLASMINILKKSLPHSIKFNVDIEQNLPAVKASSTHIEQMVMNLIVNARDAMPDGGEVTVRAWGTSVNEIYARQLDIQPGKYVIMTVGDTGHGLSEETMERIFEPYFTTKKTGTGLGLATVYAIIKNAGGSIVVKSNRGKGALFTIYIPQA